MAYVRLSTVANQESHDHTEIKTIIHLYSPKNGREEK